MRMAKQNLAGRSVEVNRARLIQTLIANKEQHVKDYNEAMAGYKSQLLKRIDEAFEKAKMSINASYIKIKEKVSNFTDEDILKQSDSFVIFNEICVDMQVPRCYDKEYQAAIDLASWDVNDTIELSYAEFVCFVKDEWDWKADFAQVTNFYKSFAG